MAENDCTNPEEHCDMHACQLKYKVMNAEIAAIFEIPATSAPTAEPRSMTRRISADPGRSDPQPPGQILQPPQPTRFRAAAAAFHCDVPKQHPQLRREPRKIAARMRAMPKTSCAAGVR